MIIWDTNPVAFSLGPVEVRWYGLVYALGFLLAYAILRAAARHKSIGNLTEKGAEDFILWLMLGSILAARLAYALIYQPAYYLANPLEIPALWHGGLSIHGGLLGAALVTLWFCRRHKVSFHRLADTLVLPLALVIVFGRMANYANAELWGRATDVAWCVQFPTAQGCRHPSQIYEAFYTYALFIALLVMRETRRWRDGTLFWTFITLYGILRFIVTFYREYDPGDPAVLGLSIGQWLSLFMAAAGAVWFLRSRRNTKHK
jgi:phosphatidylglycerol:prolipoprotein diacylglycerol transferase